MLNLICQRWAALTIRHSLLVFKHLFFVGFAFNSGQLSPEVEDTLCSNKQ